MRKRVIKILRDICIECPDFPKIPEICVKMIRRVNDEEGIKKLVMEVFQNMWFTPVKDRPQLDHRALLRKVMNITEVVATSSKDMGLEWFETLLLSVSSITIRYICARNKTMHLIKKYFIFSYLNPRKTRRTPRKLRSNHRKL